MHVRRTWRSLIIGGLLIWGGCQQVEINLNTFRARLFLTLTSSVELFYLDETSWYSEKIISEQEGTWKSLLGYESWSKEDFKTSRFCLFIFIPNNKKKITGKLKLIEISDPDECQKSQESQILQGSKQLEKELIQKSWTLSHVRWLKTIIQGPSQKPIQLILEGYIKNPKDSRGQNIHWIFPLYNIAADDIPSKVLNTPHNPQRYASSRELTYLPGLKVMALERFTYEQIEDSRILSKKDKLCHRVDKDCKQTVPYQCDECPGGWYEIRGNGCQGGGNKYCGINRCGEKNRPACNGGNLLSIHQKKEACFNNSPIGICSQEFEVECLNNQLVCL